MPTCSPSCGERSSTTEPPGSLLVQLELGLGAGFLQALGTPADEVRGLVLDCVDRDPRLDWNLDERDDYYAQLLLEARVDVGAVDRLVAAHEPVSGEDHSTLPLDVLVRMGVRGSREAHDALARYLEDGADVTALLLVLQGDGPRTSEIPAWRSAMEGLGAALCRRFSSRVELRSALEDMRASFSVASDAPPWSLWAARHPMVADALRDYDGGTQGEARRAPALRTLSTVALLAIRDPSLGWRVARVLCERSSEADVRSMIAAARFESLPMRGPALRALAHQQRPEVLEIAAELCDETEPGRLRADMSRALQLLPYEQTRSLARVWLVSRHVSRRRAAAGILEAHSEAEDLPTVRAYLCRDPLDRDTSDLYVVCSLAGALGRLPERGPYPELTSIFYGIPYSFGRQHVVRAIAQTDPAFAHTQGVECLWDCQSATREFGASRVDVNHSAARARLRVIAADPAEHADAQTAARSRLADRPTDAGAQTRQART